MDHNVRVIRAADRRPGQPTSGMVREEAFATGELWAGIVRTESGMVSGWHHHGEHQTAIYVLAGTFVMESGPSGSEMIEALPGDFLFVPPRAVHRESNPAGVESQALVVRSGSGEVVVNVDGPDR